MDDDRDSDEVEDEVEAERHPAFRSGRVRIIGAQPADPTLSVPAQPNDAGSNRAGTDEHANGSATAEQESGAGELGPDDVSAGSELPHWTEMPTGEVPAVLAREGAPSGEDVDPWSLLPAPTWREGEEDWDVEAQSFEPSMLSQGDAGIAPRQESEQAERQPWTFELSDEDVPDIGEGGQTGGAEEDLLLRRSAPGPDRSGKGGPSDEETLVSSVDAFKAPGVRVDEESDLAESVAVGRRRRGRGLHRASAAESTAGSVVGSVAGSAADDLVDAGGDLGGARAILEGGETSVAEESGIGASARERIRRPKGWRPGPRPGPRPGTRPGPGAGPGGGEADLVDEDRSAAEAPVGPRGEVDDGSLRRPVARAAPLAPGLRRARPLRPPTAATVAPSRRPTEGRNMPAAVVTGAVLLGVLVLALHIGNVASAVVIAIVAFLATAEAYAAFRKAGYGPATLLGLLASVSLTWATYAKGQVAVPLLVVLLVVFTLIWFMVGVQPNADPVLGTATTLFVFCWIGVFSSFAALLLNPTLFPHRHGIAFLAGGILTGIAYDVGALAIGRWLGRHPLAPSISPNKTWEGAIGGAVFAVVAGVAVVQFIHPWTLGKAAVLGVVVAVVAPLGDFSESLLKRRLGLKNMGRMLPGHGGLLDRVDGLLFVVPATYYLVKAFHLG